MPSFIVSGYQITPVSTEVDVDTADQALDEGMAAIVQGLGVYDTGAQWFSDSYSVHSDEGEFDGNEEGE